MRSYGKQVAIMLLSALSREQPKLALPLGRAALGEKSRTCLQKQQGGGAGCWREKAKGNKVGNTAVSLRGER